MRKIPGFISFVGISFTMCGCGQDAPISPIKHTKEQAKSTKVYSASQFPRMQRDKSFLDYEIIHKSGKSVIPWAVAMESKFGEPNTDHFITHFGFPNEKENTWNSECFFGDRYIFTMQIQIAVDYQKKIVSLVGRPSFYVTEIISATPDGSDAVGRNFKFGEKEFQVLSESDWDFGSIGFDTAGPPVLGFDLVKAMTQAPRYPISLTK